MTFPLWHARTADQPDHVVAFRGHFEIEELSTLTLRHVGASWYEIWIDGEPFDLGPARFKRGHAEWLERKAPLAAGPHVLAVLATHTGVDTRMLPPMEPFIRVEALDPDRRTVPIRWRSHLMAGYAAQVRRINPELGWIEWCDTRQNPADWQAPGFDDQAWPEPEQVNGPVGDLPSAKLAPVIHQPCDGARVASGPLTERFGYDKDDPAARFMLRQLEQGEMPPDGQWRRYDLGRVRLVRPRFRLDLSAGAVVEFAYAEQLYDGRVAPNITLSLGPSCNFDHYVARGGPQWFGPLTPRGGRFVEVHVLAPEGEIRFLDEGFEERRGFGEPIGHINAGDDLLDRIWQVGIDTLVACSEDALTDNPTRERGQWMGDVATVGLEIATVGWDDVRLVRRGLVQSAQCARADGLVAGQCPGTPIYMPTYAAQWTGACIRYYEMTGDLALLEEMIEPALRNQGAFEGYLTGDGLAEGEEWVFIDWGYARNEGPICAAYNLHYLESLRNMCRWGACLGRADVEDTFVRRAATIEQRLHDLMNRNLDAMGFHALVLALRLGLLELENIPAALEGIVAHIRRCFPMCESAPRLASPDHANPRLITPYFMHYALPELIERGMMDTALEIMRACWGWMLDHNRTTHVEVFDTRWSHCHQWAGCPTWQLSRYLLGLWPRFDLGERHFVVNLQTGSHPAAAGRLPLGDGHWVDSSWARDGAGNLDWTLTPSAPLTVLVPGSMRALELGTTATWTFDPEGFAIDAPAGLAINQPREKLARALTSEAGEND